MLAERSHEPAGRFLGNEATLCREQSSMWMTSLLSKRAQSVLIRMIQVSNSSGEEVCDRVTLIYNH